MRKQFLILFTVLCLVSPFVLGDVKIQLGSPYVDIEDFSQINFTFYPNYYEICSLEKTVIPVFIKNKNNFLDTFQFKIDKEYVFLPLKEFILNSGKGAILPLTVSPDLEENTTIRLDITTKNEGVKRSVLIKTNIRKCYSFDLKLEDKDEICGCEKKTYAITLQNGGIYNDSFVLDLNAPEGVDLTLTDKSIEVYGAQKKEINLEVNPACDIKGTFNVDVQAVSKKTKLAKKSILKLAVTPQKECYSTIINADDARIGYLGKNIPVIIKNKGIRDLGYILSVEGIDWYSLSQREFSIGRNKEKIINLALNPAENVIEGRYNIEIKAKSNGQEFTKAIRVELRRENTFFKMIMFYLNYLRYYLVLIVFLVIILLLVKLIMKRKGKKEKDKEKEKAKKEAVKKVKLKKYCSGFFVYIALLILLILIIYFSLRYKPYYEKVSNILSDLFIKYIVPYSKYFRYVIVGIGILLILFLIIDLIIKKSKKRKIRIKKSEEKKIAEKKKDKRFIKIFLIIIFELIFLGIIVYSLFYFGIVDYIKDFIVFYYPYILIGIGISIMLILILHFHAKKIS